MVTLQQHDDSVATTAATRSNSFTLLLAVVAGVFGAAQLFPSKPLAAALIIGGLLTVFGVLMVDATVHHARAHYLVVAVALATAGYGWAIESKWSTPGRVLVAGAGFICGLVMTHLAEWLGFAKPLATVRRWLSDAPRVTRRDCFQFRRADQVWTFPGIGLLPSQNCGS